MSIESVSKALRVSAVKGTTKLVLLGIANHDGDNGAFPSIRTLAGYAVCSTRRVQQCIAELEAAGLITIELNAGGLKDWREDRRPNRYALHFDGVKPTAPRGDDGVKSGAERGEIQSTNGVKPTSPKPSSNHPEEPSTSLSPGGDEFEQWWQAYLQTERPGSKGDARRAWMKMTAGQRHLALVAVHRHLGYIRDFPGRFVMPNGATWLNKYRWEDETPQEPPCTNRPKTHSGIDYLKSRLEASRGA